MRHSSAHSPGTTAIEIWKLALVGGEPHQIFVVREALRSFGVPFELTHYADAEQARGSGVELARSPQVILPDWPGRPQGVPMLFSVSGPMPDELLKG